MKVHLTCAIRTQSSQQLKSYVPFNTHGASVDLEYVSPPLEKHRRQKCSHYERGDDLTCSQCSCPLPQQGQMENKILTRYLTVVSYIWTRIIEQWNNNCP